jgi:hypothetical protein
VVSVTDPSGRILIFLTGAATFSPKKLLICTHEAEWIPFQTHYFSENLVSPGIEPGSLAAQYSAKTLFFCFWYSFLLEAE